MPYPISHSFGLDAGDVEPGPLLDHIQEAAMKVRMDVVERGPAHLVLSSSFMKARYAEDLPMMTATRCELRVEGTAGRRQVKVHARFTQSVLLIVAAIAIPWLGALVASPVNALRSLSIALPSLLAGWLLLYLFCMLDVRLWTRARIEELSPR